MDYDDLLARLSNYAPSGSYDAERAESWRAITALQARVAELDLQRNQAIAEIAVWAQDCGKAQAELAAARARVADLENSNSARVDERPYPCQHQYALGLFHKAEIHSLRTDLDRLIAQIADLTKLRLGDELVHGNVMGRIAIALFGDQNNRTDEECVARAAEIGYELSGAKLRAERAAAELAAARALLRDCLPELDGEGVTIHRVWAALAKETK